MAAATGAGHEEPSPNSGAELSHVGTGRSDERRMHRYGSGIAFGAVLELSLLTTSPGVGPDAAATAGTYWSKYTYDAIGNRTSKTDTPKTGAATVATYSYPASGTPTLDGSTGVGGPHALAGVTTKVGTAAPTTKSYLYDSSGHMRSRAGQTITWDLEGRIASTTATSGATAAKYVYDAGGTRLLRRDADGAITLYLDSTELRLKAGVATAQRWYSFGATTVATRTSAGLHLLASDAQGTGLIQISAATAAYVKRRFDPFGVARTGSSAPSGTAWSGDHAFLGKPLDSTGLHQVGARYYDASVGKFVSVDPVLDTSDAIQTNAYAYGDNNPVTKADPDGLWSFWSLFSLISQVSRFATQRPTTPTPRPVVSTPARPTVVNESSTSSMDRTTRHNLAVQRAYSVISLQVLISGGNPANVTTNASQNRVPRGSKNNAKNGTFNDGFADILYRSGNTIYVWEVKSVGQAALAAGEAKAYAAAFNVANAFLPISAKPGWSIGSPVPVGNGDFVWGTGPGAIIYGPGPEGRPFRNPKPYPLPVPSRLPVEARSYSAMPAPTPPSREPDGGFDFPDLKVPEIRVPSWAPQVGGSIAAGGAAVGCFIYLPCGMSRAAG